MNKPLTSNQKATLSLVEKSPLGVPYSRSDSAMLALVRVGRVVAAPAGNPGRFMAFPLSTNGSGLRAYALRCMVERIDAMSGSPTWTAEEHDMLSTLLSR